MASMPRLCKWGWHSFALRETPRFAKVAYAVHMVFDMTDVAESPPALLCSTTDPVSGAQGDRTW